MAGNATTDVGPGKEADSVPRTHRAPRAMAAGGHAQAARAEQDGGGGLGASCAFTLVSSRVRATVRITFLTFFVLLFIGRGCNNDKRKAEIVPTLCALCCPLVTPVHKYAL